MKLKFNKLAFALSTIILSTSVYAQSDEKIESLEQQIELLQRSLESLKEEQQGIKEDQKQTKVDIEEVKAKSMLPEGSPGLLNTVGEKAGVRISGFVHLDAGVIENGAGINNTNFSIYAPVLNGTVINTNKKDTLDMSIRRSRLNFDTNHTVNDKALKTHVELDMIGDGGNEAFTNGYDARIRQAYASYDGWLVGQSFTTFLNFASLGEIANFGQHANALFIRQVMVRYTGQFDGGSWSVAAENPYENKVITVAGTVTDTNKDDQLIPDLIGRVDFKGSWGTASLATLVRKFELDDPTSGGADDSTWGSAVSAVARIPLFSGSVGVQVNYGALGRYLELGPYPDAYVENGEIKPYITAGFSAIYSHTWRKGLRSTFAYAITDSQENSDVNLPTAIDKTSSIQANIFWDPMERTTLGLEYGLYGIELGNGTKQNVYRWQATAQFNF